MILSNRELHAALDAKRIIIDPEPAPRVPTVGGGHCPYDTHSVDLTLAAEISIPKPGGTFNIDLSRGGNIADHLRQHSETFTVQSHSPYVLEPNKFILARTEQRVTLPIEEGCETCLAARIEGKSSRARCGLLVHFTAPTIHPGFSGTITLEMINLGPWAFTLKPGMAIAQLIVEEVKGCPVHNPSGFQGQNTAVGLADNS